MSTCLCVFLKAPLPGVAKTRLAAGIGARRAAELYRAFVLDTFSWAAFFPATQRRFEYSPPGERRRCEELLPASRRRCELRPQVEGDLGRRLDAAFRDVFHAGYERCVVIGTDCPLLGPDEINAAFRALDSADLVLGPTPDGGYYLVGLKQPAPELFAGIAWSTERVFAQTLARAGAAGLRTRALEPVADIDTAADLPDLYVELQRRWRAGGQPFPVHTFRVLEWRVRGPNNHLRQRHERAPSGLTRRPLPLK